MSRYNILITETTQERKLFGKRWVLGAGETSEDYGHSPEVETVVDVEREIFMQDTSELNLVAIIKAVNGMVDDIRIEDFQQYHRLMDSYGKLQVEYGEMKLKVERWKQAARK